MANIILVFVLLIIAAEGLVDLALDYLDLKRISPRVPDEFEGYYDSDEYRKSQSYLRDNTLFSFRKDIPMLILTLAFILFGGFNYVDIWARSFTDSSILAGLVFYLILGLASWVISTPFTIYHTFVIEEKYGFNKTTPKTFALDQLKGMVLAALIAAPVLALILWFFEKTGDQAWLYVWASVTVIQVFLMYLAPVVIMPLFNKFIPLEEGELKEQIEDFSAEQGFQLEGIYTMDGSKRSTKANAFFTGFGRFRRIVLFDTLIEKHKTEELVAVLAHEIGHFKKKHILKQMFYGVLTSGLMFYLMGLIINNEYIFVAFKMDAVSVYASLLFFGILYSPVSQVIGLWTLRQSRKFEFEADAYACETCRRPESLVTALKTLSVDTLSNLNPHPLKVFFKYSHPPVIERIRAMRESLPRH